MKARIPLSTYRLQFNHQFTFADAAKVVGYLHELGIGDLYASPYFRAKKGSLHGYDIVDPTILNPEIGTEHDYAALVGELQARGMGQLLDIVPNHMCVDDTDNRWWMDLLENGPSSRYARYFDIDWDPVKKELKDRILLPVLGGQYGNVLERQELSLVFDDGAFLICYYDHAFPVRTLTYLPILELRLDSLQKDLATDDPDLAEYLSIITAIRHLPPYTETDPEKIAERYREKAVIRKRLAALFSGSETIGAFLEKNIKLYNGTKGEPRSFDLMDSLLTNQVYRLAHWQVATEEINYRRFFDINSLGAIRMEDEEVFQETHELIFRLIREGSVTGLRVDHPDGLYDPSQYFHRLQRNCAIMRGAVPGGHLTPESEAALDKQYDSLIAEDPQAKPFYIVGEKILIKGERMPEEWPIFSTTGYVFMNTVNGLFVDGRNAKALDDIYAKYIREKRDFPEIMGEKKKLIMQMAMSSEVYMLGHLLNTLSEKNRHTRDFTLNSLIFAIVEVIANFPVYRTYTNSFEVKERDRRYIELAVSKAQRKNPAMSASIFEYLKDVLLLRFPPKFGDAEKQEWLDFVMRFQQITGPVMAKGVEDTSFYVYNRLVSLNEVGGSPERFGVPVEAFHGQNIERYKFWPHALITTSTHDAKRGEDVRTRINVLSEMPVKWRDTLMRWTRLNKKKKEMLDGRPVPDRNEEYLLYQTLIGAWPLEDMDAAAYDDFRQRIAGYMEKAVREAKVNTSWINPNIQHEEALKAFVAAILRSTPDNEFLKDFLDFQRMIAFFGAWSSLAQTLLKITSPGVPDFYQGTELWSLSLVDPDNRRPVDYRRRAVMLRDLQDRSAREERRDLCRDLTARWQTGMVKLYLTWQALVFRRDHRELFERGDYVPLEPGGGREDHVCAFLRKQGGAAALVAVPMLLSQLIAPDALPLGSGVWGDSFLIIPDEQAGVAYRNVFTGETLSTVEREGKIVLMTAGLFANFPAALLEKMK